MRKRSQPKARLIDLRLRRALRDPQRFGDFFMFESLDIVEDECGAASLRQLRQRALEIHFRDRLFSQPPAPRLEPPLVIVEGVGELIRASGAASQVVEAVIGRQSIQPRAERRLAAEPVQLSVRGQEDFLQQILRVRRVAEHTARDAEQLTRMRSIELLERGQIAASAPLHELHLLTARGVSRLAPRRMLCHFRRSHAGSALPFDSPELRARSRQALS